MKKLTPQENKRLRARNRKQRKREAKMELEARMAFESSDTTDAITALSKAPADTTDWETVILEVLNDVKISQKEVDQREHILGLVEQTLKAHFPRAICRLFGSSDTRLGFKDSNTDIQLSLGFDQYNTIKKEGREKAAKLVRQLADHFKSHTELILSCTHVGGRVPFVKLYHVPFKTRVDLSFGNLFAVPNSSLVRLLCDSHPQVRPLLLFVRLWAIAQDITGRGRPKYKMTNYTFTWLALFACMARKQRLLPSLEDLRKQPYESNIINDWECGYGTDVAAFWQTQEEGPPPNVEGGLLALALDFFEYYADLDLFRWAVCPLVGKLVDRNILRRAAIASLEAAAVCNEDVSTDDDNDTDMRTDNGATESAKTCKAADVAVTTGKWVSASSLLNKGAANAVISESGMNYKESYDYRITDEDTYDYRITDEDAYDYRIIDTETAISDKGAVDSKIIDSVITDTGAVDSKIIDSVITDKGTVDAMIPDSVITDKGAIDSMITDSVITNEGAVDSMITDSVIIDEGAVDSLITDSVITNEGAVDSMITDSVISNEGAVDSMITDSVITDQAENSGITKKSTDYSIYTKAVKTEAAIPIDIKAVKTEAAISIDAVTQEVTAMANAVLDGDAHITDTVTRDAAVDTDSLPRNNNQAAATDDKNSTASNNVAGNEPSDDSYLNGLPEVLIPHVPRIVMRYNKIAPLAVMDVFELNINFTNQYLSHHVKSFQKKCRRSAEIIKEVMRQEKSLEALFTKIEVTL